MNPENQKAYELGATVGLIIGVLVVGSVIGLIPLSLGRKRDDEIVGRIGFFACLAGQFYSGFLGAFSMAIGFVIAIMVGNRRS